jgi:hypothetical protein
VGNATGSGNAHFAWFGATGSKSRLNFLALLRAGYDDYVINAAHPPGRTVDRELAVRRARVCRAVSAGPGGHGVCAGRAGSAT